MVPALASLAHPFVAAFSLVGTVVLLAVLAVIVAIFVRRSLQLGALARLGQPVNRLDDVPRRAELEATVVLGQRKLLQRLLPGLMHAFIFWGFLVLLTTIAEAIGEIVDHGWAIPLIGHSAGLGLVQDIFAALVLVGLAIAVWIRTVQRPDRFKGSHMREAYYILAWIASIILTLYVIKATAIAANGAAPEPPAWMPISNAISHLFSPLSDPTLETIHLSVAWAHVVLVFAFLVYIPYSKHLHIFTSEPNVFFTQTRARGYLRPLKIDLEALESSEEMPSLGAATVTDLTWKQMLDTYTCTECGRCQNVCPAWNTGKPLSPKLLVMNLRDHLFEQGPKILDGRREGREVEPVALNPGVVDDEVIWSCVTCGACMQECPVNIEHVDHIVDMRRNLVQAESRFPREAQTLLTNLENAQNPWGQQQAQRAAWAAGLGVRIVEPGTPAQDLPEYLYWVGCAGSFDDRAKRISQAIARVLSAAGVSFGILGPNEACTGDPARRMGNEYLFQTLAEANVGTLNGLGVRKIVANCPHCFNTLRNEYPDYGGTYEVIHHTQLLTRLIAEGRISPTESIDELLTYHDPCYLGRHNGLYSSPRDVLERIPGARLTEMPRHRERAFCCGAGGARMWMEERLGKRINLERTQEAVSTGASTTTVACPYCLIMLDDGAKQAGSEMAVQDVAQVLARAVGPDGANGPAPRA